MELVCRAYLLLPTCMGRRFLCSCVAMSRKRDEIAEKIENSYEERIVSYNYSVNTAVDTIHRFITSSWVTCQCS
jgi:hypothetical protein